MTERPSEWDAHPGNPYSWPDRAKWAVMATALLVTLLVGLNATSITTAGDRLTADFRLGGSSSLLETNFFAVTAWSAAAALVPLVTLPLMDTYGVRRGYLACYVLFTVLLIPQALAPNFATLVGCRAVAGAAAGTLQNAADGIAANLWPDPRARVLPLTGYVFCLVFGVTMGPVLGAVCEPLNWRWIFWLQLILCGASFPIVYIFLKETRGSVVRRRCCPEDDEEPRGNGALQELRAATTRSAVLLTTEPAVALFTLWSSFAFGLVFLSTQSIPLVFGSAFGWPAYRSGLVQSAIGLGQVLGFGACLLQRTIYIRSAQRNDEDPGVPVPEAILHLSIPTTPVALAGGLFMYGWSIYQPHWIVAAVGLVLVGFASMVIVNSASIYITDSYSTFAASAIAAVAFGENFFAAFLPLAAKPMYERLGYDWASSLLGFVGLALTAAPVLLFCNGNKIRRTSTFKE
ncbi:multidrug transporter [Cordyceps militaris CM01]|uniref:Multidrug transporter n=1 Tax=Cordyceps militaris (strain CM01) TaxID=983644 RepID=G3JN16_CORMM|nr:multidrug transporter [Cordyceps militaris CM01]EGX90198.1 multidrug transporter [Cordyceps militaris CM01]